MFQSLSRPRALHIEIIRNEIMEKRGNDAEQALKSLGGAVLRKRHVHYSAFG